MNFHSSYIALIFIVLITLGCSHETTVKIDGMTLNDWAARLESEEIEIKLDALDAISSFGMDALKLRQKLTYVARFDTNNAVKYKAVMLITDLKLSTDEFNDFLEIYNAPLIPVGNDENILYGGRESTTGDKSSVMDDLNYLKELSEQKIARTNNGMVAVPEDPTEYEDFVNSKRTESIDELIQMLNNPEVLVGLMKSGDKLDKSFAIDKLSSIGNLDTNIEEVVKKLSSTAGKDKSLEGRDLVKLLQQP